ncbi:hypothetical protein D9758_008327 [Tetrapyrgos nigripes]|uniref:C2H2-type domain-containing protein n=1 Tax=Tetrapyrgos nigripes TaxID=182062 RepID=A0A8H5GDU3_9AGAR|nr:hypothetical protein D9758_016884 [Tetrapyrgos nigripes]KAF5363137.1 hypothetical protein D9758_008327 [Tetrapyrgos nigripes]
MAVRSPASTIVQDLIERQDAIIQEAHLAWAASPRRMGVIFPPSFDVYAEGGTDDEDEEFSTWEFNAVIPLQPPKPPRVTKSGLTPSQEIANRFRNGIPLLHTESCSSLATASSLTSSDPSPITTTESTSTFDEDYVTVEEGESVEWCLAPRPKLEPRLLFRQSQVDVLRNYRAEAEAELRRSQHEQHTHEVLVCPREGCNDTLPTVTALTYHLHLHDVGVDLPTATSRMYRCNDCDSGFDTRSQLAMHACPCRSKSAPTSPIYGALKLFR